MCFQIFSPFPFLCVLNPLSLILLCVLDPTISPPPASDIARMHPAQEISFRLHTFLCKSLRAPDIDPYYGSIPYFSNTFSLLCVVDPLSFYPSHHIAIMPPLSSLLLPFLFCSIVQSFIWQRNPPKKSKESLLFPTCISAVFPLYFLLYFSFAGSIIHLGKKKSAPSNAFQGIQLSLSLSPSNQKPFRL